MNVLVVDDHPIYIDGLTSFVIQRFASTQVSHAISANQAISMFESSSFDLVLLDYNLPNTNGIELLKTLLIKDPIATIAIISGDESANIAKRALDCGACGFIPKSYSGDVLENALKVVIDGGEFIPSNLHSEIDRLDNLEIQQKQLKHTLLKVELTQRQTQVLKLLAKGYTNKQISNILNVSTETTKEHVSNLFVKFGVDNRLLCVSKAKELGIDLDH